MSTVTFSVNSSLPVLLTYKSWEEPKSKKVLRDIVKRKMVNIKARIRTNISNWLNSYDMKIMSTITCLDITVSFVTARLTFISDTHQDLTDAEFSDDGSWQLVTHLVNHIFVDDMYKVRSFIREAIDTHSRDCLRNFVGNLSDS